MRKHFLNVQQGWIWKNGSENLLLGKLGGACLVREDGDGLDGLEED